jgi:hypothetical protein
MAAGDPGSPARYYSSIAVETALSGSIPAQAQGAANTAFIVASVSGFPGSYPYTLIVDPDTSKEEVVTVVAGSGTTLSVTRGSDNTQGVAHSAGAVVRHGVSGREFREAETHIAARGFDIDQTILDLANQTHVHGIVTGEGVVVGTLKPQTLTQKTLTTPIINGATISGAFTSTATVTGGTFTSVTVTSSTISTSTLTGSFTASAATFVSPTISGSPVITGLSSVGMVNSSATPKIYVDTILGDATAAAISAASAAVSATSAATSATSAASSATASASSASASATSASAAATSAASAATSATAAATSATSAAASATAAATSATSAASSATTAAASVAAIAAYASAAATSEANALTSANSAATSAASAATSASTMDASVTAAATSAASAAASATAAATSASSALTSQTAAATSATSAAASATAAATSATSADNSATASQGYATAASTSAASAATSATSAATTYDNFDDRYLGSKSSAPTVDNDGNTLLVGAIYWNDVLNNMYVWSGTVWVQIATTSVYTAPTIGSTTIGSGATVTTITGLTLSGGLASADPTANLGLATKQYVDAVVTQINYHESVVAATTANLTATYSNGSSGVGATLTNSGTQAAFSIDGVSPTVNARILVKDQTTQTQNGIYTLTTVGDGSTNWVLTRATDADNNPSGEMKNGDELFCSGGTVNANKSFINSTTVDPIVIGTTNITFSVYYAGLPAQTGNSGKYLTTDGTTPSWGTVAGYSAPTLGSTSIASGSTNTTLVGFTKLRSDQFTTLDADGYEIDLGLMTIMGAF